MYKAPFTQDAEHHAKNGTCVANGSSGIHTAGKQTSKDLPAICAQICFGILCGLGLKILHPEIRISADYWLLNHVPVIGWFVHPDCQIRILYKVAAVEPRWTLPCALSEAVGARHWYAI